MKLHVIRAGSGPDVILSHGLGASSGTFREQVDALSGSYSVIAWDLPGHGFSEPAADESEYTREAALAHLRELMTPCTDIPVLIGHSFGGYLSLTQAILQPGTVRGLALLSTGPGYRDEQAREGWNRGVERLAERSGNSAVKVGLQHDDLVMRGLADIDVPTLILVGEQDERFHGASDYVERKIGGSRQVRIPGGGHEAHETHAAEVNAELGKFLESCFG